MSAWYEVAFGELYPVIYGHRDREEARMAVRRYSVFFKGHGPVVDIGCGNGRYMEAMDGAGVRTVGMDLSMSLLELATTSPALEGRVVRADMRRLPYLDGSAGGALSMFTSFGYFETETDNLQVLREVRRILRPRGMFLLDFVNAAIVAGNLRANTARESNGFHISERRRLEDDGRRLVKDVEVTPADGSAPLTYSERVRLYTVEELESMLETLGLGVCNRFGDYGGGVFDVTASDRAILLCERSG